MLDCKNIIIKRYVLKLSRWEIARQLDVRSSFQVFISHGMNRTFQKLSGIY